MSSDQYAAGNPEERPDQRVRSGRPRCPHCGAEQTSRRRECWLCQGDLGAPWDDAADQRFQRLSRRIAHKPAREESGVLGAFGLLVLVLGIGLGLAAPGLLILLLIIGTPAFIRMATQSADADDSAASPPNPVWAFLSSIGIIVVVGAASFAAFFVTCFVVCLGGLGINEMTRSHNFEWILVASVGSGLIPGAVVAFFLFRRLWGKRP